MPRSRIVIKGLPVCIKKALDTSTDSLFFSADNLAKQLHKHSEIMPTEYRSIFGKIGGCTEIYTEGPYHIMLLLENSGKDYRLVMKATNDHSEAYILSLYRQYARDKKRLSASKRGHN